MFQFTALAKESRDHRLFVNSPEHFADFHAYHRHLMPRHPPYALSSLATLIERSKHTEGRTLRCVLALEEWLLPCHRPAKTDGE